MASGCKPDGLIPYVGSNPTPCTIFDAGVAQLVERQPSKLNVASSNLVSRSKSSLFEIGPNSSGVERFLGKEKVSGSNPDLGSRF